MNFDRANHLRRRPAGARPGAGRTAAAVAAPLVALALSLGLPPAAGAAVYYVSSSTGDDANNGTSNGSPFETIGKMNTVTLSAGDQVRLFCGDVWRGERLIVSQSGTAQSPITVTSHPLGCANQPVISGAQPIVGWALEQGSGNVYFVDLDLGGNMGKFPDGINQLFRNGARLPHGRWPNLNAANGGYATIDSHNGTTITDAALPPEVWTGAYVQHRAAYWYIKRRRVDADVVNTLTLNEAPICDQAAPCAGWGYFLNHHRETLDQEGEWYFDDATNIVYVVSNSGVPAPNSILGSVVPLFVGNENIEDQSGVIIGDATPPLDDDVEHVIVDNLEVRDWAGNGIQMARLLKFEENRNITIRNNTVIDVALFGIRLTTFIFDGPMPDRGLYGGRNCLVQDNVIDGANLAGIETFSVDSIVERNTIRNIGLLSQLNADGLGCMLNGNNCAIHGNGIRMMVEDETRTGNGNTIRLNRLEQIGWTGIDDRGPFNVIENNVVVEPSSTLAEGAGIRVYDGNVFASSRAHDVTVRENIVLDPVGAFHGMPPPRNRPWAYGINIDFADAVETDGNTVAGAPAYGMIYSFARGTATGNTLWNNSDGPAGVAHVRVLDTDGVSRLSLFGNAIYARVINRPVLAIGMLGHLTGADENYYFNPYDDKLVRSDDVSNIAMTLPVWQATSGRDGNTSAAWLSLAPADPDVSVLFVNDTDTTTMVPLAEPHFDLDQSVVVGPITLPPFSSRILIGGGPEVIFADGFESGDLTAWSLVIP